MIAALVSLWTATTKQDRRGVAQPGSAPQWGCGGRRFKSSRPDQFKPVENILLRLRLGGIFLLA